MTDRSDGLEFTKDFVEEYYRLFNKNLQERFQPALTTFTHALRTLLDSKFPPSQRLRLHIDAGRIKSANRLLLKAQTPKYRPQITSSDDIFRIVPDIVGTRITCNTLADVHAVVSVIDAAANLDAGDRSIIKQSDDWKDDFIAVPKDSGYRAINLIVGIPVPVDDRLVPVTCEIQVRTLLQHAWGELTHEDTYKPGVKVPELVQILSKRLATTLAVLDEIAQDLRNELDKVERLDLPRPPLEAVPTPTTIITKPPQEALTPAPTSASGTQESAIVASPALGTEAVEITQESVKTVYRNVYGEEAELGSDALKAIRDKMAAEGLHTPAELEIALRKTREAIEKVEATQDTVALNAFGRILSAVPIYRDEQRGLEELRHTLEELTEQFAREGRFQSTYFVGREAFGTVVHVTWDYALVQLPEGDKGILHATKMKHHPWEYVAVKDVVNAGDTVRVRIIAVDSARQRVELELVHEERAS